MTRRNQTTQPALATLFARLVPRLRTAGLHLLGNADDASDAMQDTFVKLWNRREPANEGVVITAMRNTCIDALRRRREKLPIEDTAITDRAEPRADDETGRLYDEVNAVISATLSARDREIMLMRDRDGFELDAISARTGLTEANIRVILSRARRTVRDAYRERRGTHKTLE